MEISNARLRDELFYSLREVQVLIERWRQRYNTVHPRSSLGYRPYHQSQVNVSGWSPPIARAAVRLIRPPKSSIEIDNVDVAETAKRILFLEN